MGNNLLTQTLAKFFLGVILLGLLIFLPAWSLHYWQGWLLMGILFVPMFVAGLVMLAKNPDLLRKRLNAKEQEAEQKTVVKLSGLSFIEAFVVAGLNWRFGWWVLPDWAVWVAAGLFLTSYLLYAEVLRENTYLSRTIEVQENQKVIDTGLYGIVRHPNSLRDWRHCPFARADVRGHVDGDAMGFADGSALEEASHEGSREGVPSTDSALHFHGRRLQE